MVSAGGGCALSAARVSGTRLSGARASGTRLSAGGVVTGGPLRPGGAGRCRHRAGGQQITRAAPGERVELGTHVVRFSRRGSETGSDPPACRTLVAQVEMHARSPESGEAQHIGAGKVGADPVELSHGAGEVAARIFELGQLEEGIVRPARERVLDDDPLQVALHLLGGR
jgi:hypothetical protein